MTLRDFQQDFNKNFNRITKLLDEVVSDFTDQLDSPRVKESLNSALDVLRSFSKCLGFRVSQLTQQNVEIVLPRKLRLMDEGTFNSGALMAAGFEAAKLLWSRNAPESSKDFTLKNATWNSIGSIASEAYIRIELNNLARETLLAELAQMRRSILDLHARYLDENHKLCAELSMQVEITSSDLLESK